MAETQWERHWDEDSKSYYYYDPATDGSQWDVPKGWEEYFAEKDEGGEESAPGDQEAHEEGGEAGVEGEQDEGGIGALEEASVEPTEENHAVAPEATTSTDPSIATTWAETDEAQHDKSSSMGEEATEYSVERGAEGHADDLARDDGAPDSYGDADVEDTGDTKACPWIKIVGDDGEVYYHNKNTEESLWDEPEEYRLFYETGDASSGVGEAEAGAEAEAEAEGTEDREDGAPPRSPPEDTEGVTYSPAEPLSPGGPEEAAGSPSSSSSRGDFAPVVKDTAKRKREESLAHEASKSPSASPGVTGSGSRLSPHSSGEAYSPNHDWQGDEQDAPSPAASPVGSYAAMSPEIRDGLAGDGFAVDDGDEDRVGFEARTPPDDMPQEEMPRMGRDDEVVPEETAEGMRLSTPGEEEEMRNGAEGGAKTSDGLTEEERMEKAGKALTALGQRLEEKDAIMEPDVYGRIAEYQSAFRKLHELKGDALSKDINKESLNMSLKKLIAGYHGYAQQTALVNSWLHMASTGKEDTESIMLEQLTELIKENFDAKKADALLDSASGVPSWLTAMQADDGWRRTLIELAREHRGSALLRFVLKQLSDRGHHREIAAIISETDLFSVFNGVLRDALARIPADDDLQVDKDLAHLKRMCCSTSYMFMYSQQLLLDLEQAANRESSSEGSTEENAGDKGRKGSPSVADGSSAHRDGGLKRGREKESPDATKDTSSESNANGLKRSRVGESGKAVVSASSEEGKGEGAGGGSSGGSGDGEKNGVGRRVARVYRRLRQELAMHLYGAGGATRGMAGAHGSDASGSGTGSARPSGVFLRRVEEALFPALPTGLQGASSLSSSSAARSPDAHQTALRSSPRSPMGGLGMPEADARAASEAVVSMLGHVGRGASSGAGGPGSGLGGGRGGAGSGARRMAGLSSAVETLVSAFRLSGPRLAALEGPEAVPEGQDEKEASDDARPSASLVRHPMVVEILLEALFDPGFRAQSRDLRTGCCALLAYASCVEVPGTGAVGGGGSLEKERVDIKKVSETSHSIYQACEECFNVRPSQLPSLQARLRRYAQHPVVTLGILKWIQAQVSKEVFCASPSYLSYAPVFLKLCGQFAEEHPPQRSDVFDILKLMLSARTAPDTPQATKLKLKQRILLRMVELMVKGYVLPVLEHMKSLAVASGLDQPLLRFFVLKVVGVAAPRGGDARKGYAPAFIKSMGDLLVQQRVKLALLDNQVPTQDRETVNRFARYILKFQEDHLSKEALAPMKDLHRALESR